MGYRWREDVRILSLAPASPGWLALFRKTKEEDFDPKSDSIYDLAWVEPIACFALVEFMEREERFTETTKDGLELWTATGRTECDAESAGGDDAPNPHWPHTSIRPIWLHSGEMFFPGVDEITKMERGPDVILGPCHDLHAEWVLERLRGDY